MARSTPALPAGEPHFLRSCRLSWPESDDPPQKCMKRHQRSGARAGTALAGTVEERRVPVEQRQSCPAWGEPGWMIRPRADQMAVKGEKKQGQRDGDNG